VYCLSLYYTLILEMRDYLDHKLHGADTELFNHSACRASPAPPKSSQR